MMQAATNPYSFLSGFVEDKNTGRVIAQIDELKDAGATDSELLKWTRTDRKWYSFDLSWHATRICVLHKPELQVIAVGPDGIVAVGSTAGVTEEEIDNSDDGPKRRGDIRDLRIIGKHAYVAGMSRQVYRREGPNIWTRQDAGVVQPLGTFEVAGINSIDGLSEMDIYAVGFGGEIWRFVRNKWRQIDSPTNLVLHRVRVIANTNNLVFACGQEGTLLRGHGDTWEHVEHDTTSEDLWGMEWFNDELYVACDEGLFVLSDTDTLEKIDMSLGAEWTCRHLHANDGVMWSFGPKHICWTEDAKKWNDVTP